jgi:hypothetical protein
LDPPDDLKDPQDLSAERLHYDRADPPDPLEPCAVLRRANLPLPGGASPADPKRVEVGEIACNQLATVADLVANPCGRIGRSDGD